MSKRSACEAVAPAPRQLERAEGASIAIAVESSAPPRPGLFYIHLPTEQRNGRRGAPARAVLRRHQTERRSTSAKPKRLLLDALADLAHHVVQTISGRGSLEGAAIST